RPFWKRPFQAMARVPAARLRPGRRRIRTPLFANTAGVTRAGAASLKRATTAVRVLGRRRTERGATVMKPSVSFSQKERSTDELCPSLSVAEITQRQRPSGPWLRFFAADGHVNA